ncbi:MAG: hypothetical protein JXA91_03450 [Candidatus Thermoplasmatota archaeon]|nr:hypothetical protein [Candidatus Thermoplasmatota archaeon]
MERGTIPINKDYELEYRYYDKDTNYKYFNRKFEIYLLGKKSLKKNYLMHMDNSNTQYMLPFVYKANQKKRFDFGVTTLNWNDVKTNFLDFVVAEIGEDKRENVKKAIGKLSSPKL